MTTQTPDSVATLRALGFRVPDADILARGAVLLPGERNMPEDETAWQRMLRETDERQALARWQEAARTFYTEETDHA